MQNLTKTIKYSTFFAIIALFFGLSTGVFASAQYIDDVDTLGVSNITDTAVTMNGFIELDSEINMIDFWFEYGEDDDNLDQISSTIRTRTNTGVHSMRIKNLEEGERYYYRISASDLVTGVERGDIESFIAGQGNVPFDDDDDNDDDDDDNDNNGDDEVRTLSATNIDEDSARLRGEVTDGNNLDVWFVISRSDSTPSCNDNDIDYNVSGDYDDGDDFSRTVSGLREDTKYYFRACTDEDSGSIKNFRTDDDNDNGNSNNGDDNVEVITTGATGVTSSTAILNGLVSIDNNESARVWFEYGPTSSLGYQTSKAGYDDGTHSVSRVVTGLTSGRIQFYRIVAEDDDTGDIVRGALQSYFTTGGNTGGTTSTGTGSTGTTNTGSTGTVGGASTSNTTVIASGVYLNVDLVAEFEEASVGDIVDFEVTYENLTSSSLKDVELKIDFPEAIKVRKSEYGTIGKHKVELEASELVSKAKGTFIIQTEIMKDAKKETVLVSVIEGIHDHPTKSNTKVDVVDYSILRIVKGGGSSLAGAAFFAGAFFPKTFGGWLLLVILILLLILLARYFYYDRLEKRSTWKIKNSS